MGNNAAFSNFEAVILATYKHKALTKELLSDIVEVFADQDADSGGYNGDLVDGKDVYEIVIEVAGGTLPEKPVLPDEWKTWTDEQHAASDAYQDALRDEFRKFANLR